MRIFSDDVIMIKETLGRFSAICVFFALGRSKANHVCLNVAIAYAPLGVMA